MKLVSRDRFNTLSEEVEWFEGEGVSVQVELAGKSKGRHANAVMR